MQCYIGLQKYHHVSKLMLYLLPQVSQPNRGSNKYNQFYKQVENINRPIFVRSVQHTKE
jgi:hypothetical protein